MTVRFAITTGALWRGVSRGVSWAATTRGASSRASARHLTFMDIPRYRGPGGADMGRWSNARRLPGRVDSLRVSSVGRRDHDARQIPVLDPGGADRGAGGLLPLRLQLELRRRRARRLGAEILEQGLALQDLGRRDDDGLAARLDTGEVLLHRDGRQGRRRGVKGDRQARVAPLRTEGGNSHLVLRRYALLRHRRVDRARNPAPAGRRRSDH